MHKFLVNLHTLHVQFMQRTEDNAKNQVFMRLHPNGSLKNIMAFSAFSNKVFSTKKMSTCCLSILHDHINRNLNLKSLLEHIPCQYQNLVVCILIFYYCIFIPGLSSHLGKV